MTTMRKSFEDWAIAEGYAERNRHGLWFANSVHERSLWIGYEAATERAAKVVEEVGPKDGPLALVTQGFATAIRGGGRVG